MNGSIDVMESWLKQSGAAGLDDLELANFPETGRGIRSRRRFEEGEKILTIPTDILWTVKQAHADPLFGPAVRSLEPPLSTDDTLITYILFVRARKSGYDGRRGHVAALPESYTSSILFSDAELEVCAGSSLYTTTKHLHSQIEVDYKDLVVRLFVPFPELFPLDKLTLDDYKWALCTVWSRGMDFKLSGGDSIRLLAPFADMLNHSQEARKCHVYDPSTGNLSVLAGKAYRPGDQVFINYGPMPNNRLSRLYGFVMPNNPNDSYDLVLSTHPAAPYYGQKLNLWTLAGLESTSTIPLTLSDPLPNAVLQYLRIQRLDISDLALVASQQNDAARHKINNSNEEEILQFLIDAISGILEGFAISAEKLEQQLSDGFYETGGNAWMAAHVSLGEQKVLSLAKRRAETLLNEVKSGEGNQIGSPSSSAQCANCRTVPDRLMRCGRCNSVGYCGRPCQVAHYKQHKAICRTMAARDSI